MAGMALKLFKMRTGKAAECKAVLHGWPHLEHLIEEYELNPVDVKLAATLLKNYTLKSEAAAAFIAHLSLSSRNGHLLVKLEDGEILPSVDFLWKTEAPIEDRDIAILKALILEGFKEILNNPEFSGLFSSPSQTHPTSYLCRVENMIYFQRYFKFETMVLTHLKRIEGSEPTLKLAEVAGKLKVLVENQTLLEAQAEAILKATTGSLTLIQGGPGTGKTYTAGYLIKVLLESLDSDSIKIALAAPTGKAASNLQNSLEASLPNLKGKLKAKTLHSLLGIKESGKRTPNLSRLLNADVILIDESSMIDVAMMARLLSAVKAGSRLIFLGDQHQLPSVEAGTMFSDLVRLLPGNTTVLHKCVRAELQELIDLGQAVNEGNFAWVVEMLENGTAVTWLKNEEDSVEAFFNYASGHFPVILQKEMSEEEILKAFNKFRILSPLRKGIFGVDSLNQYFFQHLVKKHLKNHSVMVPIMLCKSDAKLELFNGEVGVLILNEEKDYALFSCKKNGFRRVPALVLPQYEYAYCLSIHKAQGSEFDHVLCLVPEGSEHFGREVLYTAVTRVRKKLEIFGNEETLKKTIENKTVRLSGLHTREESRCKQLSY